MKHLKKFLMVGKLLSLLLVLPVQVLGASKLEAYNLDQFTIIVNSIDISSRGCLRYLEDKGGLKLNCTAYKIELPNLNKMVLKVMSILPYKRRYREIAENSVWYNAFVKFDRMQLRIAKITRLLNDRK